VYLIVGMDFGTTNSGMSWFDGENVKLLPLDPANPNPAVARTALYISNDQNVAIGRDALNRYFDQNVGRPMKIKKVWVGEVEVYGADMYYVTDVYALMDVLSPGRLFLSIKSGLRDPDYSGTMVGHFYYSLETLVAVYLSLTKLRAERILGQEITGVVLGRPVHFSLDAKTDALAENRLLEAALNAGFREVYFQYEPVAAAYHYAATVGQTLNVLVFDFGGGTLDITIMRIDGKYRQVLATGGLPVAGDLFDQKLVRAKLPKHFGENSHYGPYNRRLPLPAWIFDLFSNWQTIIELQTPDNRRILSEIAQTADDRQGIEGLISLVANNYSLKMFDLIESTKRDLSKDLASLIRLQGPDFHVTELVTRSEFEQIISAEIQAIYKHIDETVKSAGLKHEDVDAVIRTGGSSEIPVFKYMLADKFGIKKIRAIDTFSSVTSGLGIMANAIATGEMAVTAQRKSALKRSMKNKSEENISPISLVLLQKRMAVQEDQSSAQSSLQAAGLVLLTAQGELDVVTLALELPEDGSANLPPKKSSHDTIRRALLVSAFSPLLVATSRYRFFLSTPAQLADLQHVGMEQNKFFHLRKDEFIMAISPWSEIRTHSKFVLVTTQGFTRAYPLEKISATIEGSATLQFDQPLPGSPVAMFGSDQDDQLVLIADSGRATRLVVKQLPLRGQHILKLRKDERIIHASSMESQGELLLVTAGGYGKRLPIEWIPGNKNRSSRGRKMISRPGVQAVIVADGDAPVWAITATKLIRLNTSDFPSDGSATTRTYSIFPLKDEPNIVGLLSPDQTESSETDVL
jgi:hypothetical chaperone protein